MWCLLIALITRTFIIFYSEVSQLFGILRKYVAFSLMYVCYAQLATTRFQTDSFFLLLCLLWEGQRGFIRLRSCEVEPCGTFLFSLQ